MEKKNKSKKNIKKTTTKNTKNKNVKTKAKKLRKPLTKKEKYIMISVLFAIGVLLIFSSYAWFSTSLNVRIRQFDMIVSRNSGLTISFDGVTYDSFLDLTSNSIIDDINGTYPMHSNQWASNGLTPVSTIGILDKNQSKFNIFASGGVRYRDRKKEKGYIRTTPFIEEQPAYFSYIVAFDLFVKNKTGSPVSDNLYIGKNTIVTIDNETNEEMIGLVNSIRIGFLKIGSVDLNAPLNEVQNITCHNNCEAVIYEPRAYLHSDLSIERAQKYYINLQDGEYFPSYGCIKSGGPLIVDDTVSGTVNINQEFFRLQKTMTERDIDTPLFTIPNGITKMRVYVWIEGQDIDSLETDSEGADITISIDLNKDTEGYEAFN